MNYVNWIETPIPMYLEIYMWNWTNTKDVHNHSIRPHLDELGPYVFSEVHKRVGLDWHNENDTISFNQTRTWVFQPEMSNGDLDDLITNINVISVVSVCSYYKSAILCYGDLDSLQPLKLDLISNIVTFCNLFFFFD